MPSVYEELVNGVKRLEQHMKNVQVRFGVGHRRG